MNHKKINNNKTTPEREKILIGYYNKSEYMTYAGIVCSILGISSCMFQSQLLVPMILLFIAGICDAFDGTIARMCKNRSDMEKQFGVQLDSLADVVSFVVYPVVLLFKVSGINPIVLITASIYVLAGVIRLGWFNITTENNHGYYFGLPVTTIAFIIPIIYYIFSKTQLPMTRIFPIAYGIFALLFVANVKIKKPDIKITIALILLLIGVFIIINRAQ